MMWLWFVASTVLIHSSLSSQKLSKEGVYRIIFEAEFCNVSAKVPTSYGYADLTKQFNSKRGGEPPMEFKEELQTQALKCVSSYYEEGCDYVLVVFYYSRSSEKVAALAAWWYSEYGILEKSTGMFGCSCEESYADTTKNQRYLVGTLYCAFSTESSSKYKHEFNGEKYLDVTVGEEGFDFRDHDGKLIPVRYNPGVLNLEARDGKVKEGLHVSALSIDKLEPPTYLERHFTQEVAEELWVLLTDTYMGIKVADDVEEEYSYVNLAKELLIEELAGQERYAMFRWVERTASAMSSDRLSPDVFYDSFKAGVAFVKDCGPYIVYNLNITRAHYSMVKIGCGLLKTNAGNFGTCYMTLEEKKAEVPEKFRRGAPKRSNSPLKNPFNQLLTRLRGIGA